MTMRAVKLDHYPTTAEVPLTVLMVVEVALIFSTDVSISLIITHQGIIVAVVEAVRTRLQFVIIITTTGVAVAISIHFTHDQHRVDQPQSQQPNTKVKMEAAIVDRQDIIEALEPLIITLDTFSMLTSIRAP